MPPFRRPGRSACAPAMRCSTSSADVPATDNDHLFVLPVMNSSPSKMNPVSPVRRNPRACLRSRIPETDARSDPCDCSNREPPTDRPETLHQPCPDQPEGLNRSRRSESSFRRISDTADEADAVLLGLRPFDSVQHHGRAADVTDDGRGVGAPPAASSVASPSPQQGKNEDCWKPQGREPGSKVPQRVSTTSLSTNVGNSPRRRSRPSDCSSVIFSGCRFDRQNPEHRRRRRDVQKLGRSQLAGCSAKSSGGRHHVVFFVNSVVR